MAFKLRKYQEQAVDSIFNFFRTHKTGNPLVLMPTGTGKSLVIGFFVKYALMRWPGTRVMKLTHVKELIEQNLSKLTNVWPLAPVGIYSAGMGRKDSFYPITFGGVATVVKAHPEIFGKIDILLIDECHLVSPKETTTYQRVIAGLKTINPKMRVVGFTATDWRLGSGPLIDLEDPENPSIFTDVAIDMTTKKAFLWFLNQGYLCRLIPKRPNVEIDLTTVRTKGGEYNEADLARVTDKVLLPALKETIAVAELEGRQKWLGFVSGLENVERAAEILNYLGIKATFVHSKISKGERERRLEAFERGEYTAMVNDGVLTTGFDSPYIDLIFVLRASKSTALWVQMLGRGTRPVYAEGFDLETKDGRLAAIAASCKPNCTVLDFAANSKSLGPINDPVKSQKKGKGTGEAPMKSCPECYVYNYAGVRFCSECGYEFPQFLKIGREASHDELIAEDKPVAEEWFDVHKVEYRTHRKEGKPNSLKVTYHSGMRTFNEYICLDHRREDGSHTYASSLARTWWRNASNDEPPESVYEAIQALDTLNTPKRIRVSLKKMPEILDYEY